MRKRIFEIIELAHLDNDKTSKTYDRVMLCSILASIIPLCFKENLKCFVYIDLITVSIFIIDYLLRWITADYRQNEFTVKPFFKYIFTPWAIIDLVSILPSISILNNTFKLLRLLRLFKLFRIFKIFRYSKQFIIIQKVIYNTKESLMAVCILAIGYILSTALIIFNVESESFKTYFDAVYWATVSLTTVGYGDIYPVTTFGRIVTMFSSVFGIAIIALPAGIITAGYMEEVKKYIEK